jgi:hypothetical protein
MFEYFTEADVEQLKNLKENLLVQPQDYFFKPFENVSEFKAISLSMGALQWQFLSSGLSLLIETFKALGKAIYFLITLNFSVAGDKFCKATKAALAAIAKLILELGLLLLHATRFLTLLIVTFIPEFILLSLIVTAPVLGYLSLPLLGLGGLITGVVIACFCFGLLPASILFRFLDNNHSKELDKIDNRMAEMEDYKRMKQEVGKERAEIFEAIRALVTATPTCITPEEEDRLKFFSTNSKLTQQFLRQTLECRELLDQLNELLHSYPDFIASRFREPGYIRGAHIEMVEHHAKVMSLVEECFKRIKEVFGQRENSVFSQI